VSKKTPDLGSDLRDIRFLFYFDILRFAANCEERSRAREGALVQAALRRSCKKKGYNSQAIRRTLPDSVTAPCPAITPHDWQVDLAEALTLGLDSTVIAGTGSGKTLPWAMPLLLEQNRDRICRR